MLATFELSYSQLKDEEKRNWRALGVFPASFFGNAAAAVWGMGEGDADSLIGLLLRYSLIDFNETLSRYEMHDLLAEYARSQMDGGEEDAVRLKHASHYKDILSAADDLYLEGKEKILVGLRLFDLEWENIRAGQIWVAQNITTSKEIAKICSEYTNQTYCINLRLHPRMLISWHESSLSADRFLEDRSAEGVDLGNLGNAYADLGDAKKAIEFYEQQLVIVREIGDRRGEAFGSWNLGLQYESAGEFQKAIEVLQICVDYERAIGHPDAEKDAAKIEEIRSKLDGEGERNSEG